MFKWRLRMFYGVCTAGLSLLGRGVVALVRQMWPTLRLRGGQIIWIRFVLTAWKVFPSRGLVFLFHG